MLFGLIAHIYVGLETAIFCRWITTLLSYSLFAKRWTNFGKVTNILKAKKFEGNFFDTLVIRTADFPIAKPMQRPPDHSDPLF